MFSLYLTQSGGFLGTIAKPFGWILNGIYELLSHVGIENVAICIILFTFIAKALMIPLTIKQQKFSKMSSVMQPELAKVQEKYKGKKDEASVRKMQLEQQAVYEKYGANPTAGCLPLLITFPIMLAMYRVIQNIPAYIPAVKELYVPIAEAVQGQNGYVDVITEMAKTTAYGANVTDGAITINHLIDVFSHFKTSQWAELSTSFPAVADVINQYSAEIMRVNSLFLDLNISNAPGWGFPGIIIPILAVVTQWLQTKMMQVKTPMDKDNPTAAAMNGMTTFMPFFSGFLCVTMPLGLGLYWVASSVFGIVQQFFVNKYMDNVDVDVLIEKSKEKADAKRAKVSGVTGNVLKEVAKTQTKSIEVETSNSNKGSGNKSMKDYAQMSSTKELNKKGEVSNKAGSIAQNANLLKNRYNDKGEK